MGEKKGNTSAPKRMSTKTFLDYFMRITNNKPGLERRFCFIIGAGASKQSGIPTGAELVEDWLEVLHERYDDEELKKWKEEKEIKGLGKGEAAKYYPQIYEKRFSIDPREGYSDLEDIMEGKEPSFGYSVLAKILAETDHNVVITTNFDSLVEDALFVYTDKRPLVCGHEALAGFISPVMRRSLIAKIHRDVLLAPKSDPQGTRILADGWKKSLANIFKFYIPVIIGYGGNDGSLMGFLNKLEPIDGGMFWCYWQPGGEPEKEILQLVMKHNGYLVPIVGFDELMLQLNDKLGYPLLHENIVGIAKEKAKNYKDQFEHIQKKLSQSQKPSDSEAKAALKRTIEKQKKDLWSIQLMASSQLNPDKEEKIYLQGLREFPGSAELTGNYASFLHSIRKDYDKAEELFKKALELDPKNVHSTGNYAQMLLARGNKKQGEKYLEKAFSLNPSNEELLVELWFYRYAHFANRFERADKEIIKLLKKGVRSPGWDLSPNIERAKIDGHPALDLLEKLAKIITGDVPLDTLEACENSN